MTADKADPKPLSKVEEIKEASHYLRGTLAASLEDRSTGAIADADTNISKFHGIYQQDHRDQRTERKKAGLEKAFIFMIRIRVPGGVCTPEQWLKIDALADTYGSHTLKLTTRQAFQLHFITKDVLKTTMQGINAALMDTIAACGDVNRNVMCNPNPWESALHAPVLDDARAVSVHLTPRTTAYHEIWLDGEKVGGGEEEEPIYGKTYLPRKFKIGFAIPPSNDIDVWTQDLGFIAIGDGDQVAGYNVTVGGGLGMSHSDTKTYPRLADMLGFCTRDQVVDVAEKVLTVQRDFGDRTNRKHARLKYTIEDRGIDWFRGEVERRLGYKLGEPRPFRFDDSGDRYGWTRGTDNRWHYGLFIQNGRLLDTAESPAKTGLREIAKIHTGDFRLTANQNLIIGGVTDEQKPRIEALLAEYKLDADTRETGLRLNSMACVALPTCGLALAESERYLPDLVTELDRVIEECGLRQDAIIIRMTGCPNGCARPYLGEIGLVGKAPGKYNIYLGAAFDGSRLNKLFKPSVTSDKIVAELAPVIRRYATEREEGERFGDFAIRAGFVKPTTEGRLFHEDIMA
ncbi:MAG: assimilatory sulfite reductase (NADPH) hemoprotein subunit [Chthoniobacterales bacterium]|nr:assimilatory sulfite reductase (NADPH) hemoprotein subunit [Chthoniobacterales bacterium]